MEIHNGAIFHASDTLLAKLDNVQRSFLRALEVEESDAYLSYNFAPSQLRRNIGILGLMHKRVIGESHGVFRKLLPFSIDVGAPLLPGGHNKQLYGHLHEVHFQLALHFRSIYGMVYIYNGLPQYVVDRRTVTSFQKQLSIMARRACLLDTPNWQEMFSCRAR